MAAAYHSIDLARFALRPGEGRRLDLVADPGQLELAGQRYTVADNSVDARLDLSRTAAGYAVRMRFTAHVSGPCMRCLDDADVTVEVDAREVELIVLDVGAAQLLVLGPRLVDLPCVYFDRDIGVVQATHARP